MYLYTKQIFHFKNVEREIAVTIRLFEKIKYLNAGNR